MSDLKIYTQKFEGNEALFFNLNTIHKRWLRSKNKPLNTRSREPSAWARTKACKQLLDGLIARQSITSKTRDGIKSFGGFDNPQQKNGTYATYHLALAYAMYLSPQFQLEVQDIYKEALRVESLPLEQKERHYREKKTEAREGEVDTLGTYTDGMLDPKDLTISREDMRDNSATLTWLLHKTIRMKGYFDPADISNMYSVLFEEIGRGLYGRSPSDLKKILELKGLKSFAGREHLSPAMYDAISNAQRSFIRWLVTALNSGVTPSLVDMQTKAFTYARQQLNNLFNVYDEFNLTLMVVCKDLVNTQTQVFLDKDLTLSDPKTYKKTATQKEDFKSMRGLTSNRKKTRIMTSYLNKEQLKLKF